MPNSVDKDAASCRVRVTARTVALAEHIWVGARKKGSGENLGVYFFAKRVSPESAGCACAVWGDVLDDVWTTGRGNRSEQSPVLEIKQCVCDVFVRRAASTPVLLRVVNSE